MPPTGSGLGNKNMRDSKSSMLKKSRAGSVNTSAMEGTGADQPASSNPNPPKSPTKKRNSSAESNESVSSTEIDFTKHVPVYKQFDIHGKRIMKVEDDPLVNHKSMKKKKEEPEYKQNFLAMFLEE